MYKKSNNQNGNSKIPPGFDSDLFDEDDAFGDEFDQIDAPEEDEAPYFKANMGDPRHSRRVWVLLALILVVISVAVLYVYQAGDKKTILGNQPIPAGVGNTAPEINIGNGQQQGAINLPIGGGMLALQAAAKAPLPPDPSPQTMTTCPRCNTQGLPLCAACGAVMRPIENGSGLFVCPSCGSVGMPICPHCGAHMIAANSRPSAQLAASTAGQFLCPSCGGTGLPNWNQNGAPMCPNCGTQMQVNSNANPSPTTGLR